jgi:hypothetical protein
MSLLNLCFNYYIQFDNYDIKIWLKIKDFNKQIKPLKIIKPYQCQTLKAIKH